MHQYRQAVQLQKLFGKFTLNARAFTSGNDDSVFFSVQCKSNLRSKIVN